MWKMDEWNNELSDFYLYSLIQQATYIIHSMLLIGITVSSLAQKDPLLKVDLAV